MTDLNHNATMAKRTPRDGYSGGVLDGLVFNTGDFTLTHDCRHAAAADSNPVHESKTVPEQAESGPCPQGASRVHLLHTLAGLKIGFPIRRLGRWTTALIALSLSVAATVAYIAWSDGYLVETKLLFFDRDHNPNNSTGRTLEEEVEILNSPHILHLLAREMYARRLKPLTPRGTSQIARTAANRGLSSFAGPDDMEKWLVKKARLNSEVSGGTAKVALQLQGDDPAFLSSVLDAYVCRYVNYRRTLEAESRNPLQQAVNHERYPVDTIQPEVIAAQLQKIEFQRRGYQLALKLIDSGKGVFSGFVPDQSLTGLSSLTQFQEKIVKLEIKKRALAAQYTPSSKEIVVVDLEIQGVRSAMRECLVEHVQFLKKEREQLLAYKNGLNYDLSTVTAHDRVPNNEGCGGQSRGSNSWLVPREGLYMLREAPVIAKQPLLAQSGHFANRLAAYLAPLPSSTVITESNRNRDSAGTPGVSVDGRFDNSGNLFQGSPEQRSFQSVQTTPPVWQRAATANGDAKKQHTGPTNSRPRQ